MLCDLTMFSRDSGTYEFFCKRNIFFALMSDCSKNTSTVVIIILHPT